MWKSRKTATRRVDHVSLDAAAERLQHEGFEERKANAEYAELQRPGTRFTTSVDRMPLNLTVSTPSEEGVELRLRYGTFVLFDTGELEAEADRLAKRVGSA